MSHPHSLTHSPSLTHPLMFTHSVTHTHSLTHLQTEVQHSILHSCQPRAILRDGVRPRGRCEPGANGDILGSVSHRDANRGDAGWPAISGSYRLQQGAREGRGQTRISRLVWDGMAWLVV